MAVVSMNYLLESGVHFGHQTKRWNPKMKEYIFTSRDDIYIIDLQKTAKKIEEAYAAMNKIAANGGKVLFVGTRKQASEAIKDEAIRSESYYVNVRWLGGTLTNFRTIRKRTRRLEEIENMEKDGTFDKLPKKEVIKIKKEYDKLNVLLVGIRNMNKIPDAMFIVDPSKEEIAIKEARILKIPVFGIVDTNCDPDMVDYVIPGNDDAIRAVKLITGVMANSIVEANGGTIVDYVSDDKSKDLNDADIMQRAVESVKRKEDRRGRFDNRDRKPFKPYERRDNSGAPRNNGYSPRPQYEPRKPFAPVQAGQEIKKTVTTEVIKEEPVKATVNKTVKVEKVVDNSTKTVAELREIAKSKDIKGYSTMKKNELLEVLK